MKTGFKLTEQNYRYLFDNASDAMWVHDMNGTVVITNKAVEKLTGYTREELVGTNVVRFLTAELLDTPREVKRKLLKGEAIEQPVYSFVTHDRTVDTLITHPRKVVIVEGILIFNSKELRDLFDIKIFVHADTDERLIRRVRRDIEERGRDINEVLTRYQNTLKPMHQQFIEPTKNYADIIIPNDRYNTVAIDIVRTVISNKL